MYLDFPTFRLFDFSTFRLFDFSTFRLIDNFDISTLRLPYFSTSLLLNFSTSLRLDFSLRPEQTLQHRPTATPVVVVKVSVSQSCTICWGPKVTTNDSTIVNGGLGLRRRRRVVGSVQCRGRKEVHQRTPWSFNVALPLNIRW
jgi:hypothetical protein